MDLQRDEVQTRDHFRHRMFDLQARIHFEEIEYPRSVQQKFDCPRPDIIDTARCGHGGGSHLLAQLWCHHRTRRFFNNFLMSALHGTIPLAQMQDRALRIAKDLHLDMARIWDGAFEDERV